MTAGPQVFGFGLHEIAIVILAMLLGGICKGIIGIALPLIGLTVMLLVLEPKLAVAMMVIPIVLTNVNRALSAPINIHCDHSDVMGMRDSGWIA